MIKERNTTVLASDYQSTEQLQKFIKHCTGVKLTPVRNSNDAFWISGDKRGNYINGPKYYKIVFGAVTEEFRMGKPTKSGYGFDIQATGDLNAWQLMGEYRTMIKEAMADYKNKNATTVGA
jgi:hypothetical protein|tara:strand:- start:1054 stop:1416 length:363 start_codon:yes stop_codon:yes gene_type:complete